MTRRPNPGLFAVSLVLQGVVLLGVAMAARGGAAPSRVAFGLGLCFIPYAAAIWSSRAVDRNVLRALSIAVSAVFGAVLLFAPPVLSDDLYRYLWEGRLWLEGQNPFRVAPDDPALTALRDDGWTRINNKPLASLYPPLAQLLFTVAAWLGGTPASVKLVALVGHLLTVALIGRLGRDVRSAPLTIGLNPLLLSESALNGHFDLLCGTALLLSAWYASRLGFARAAAAVCTAVGLKVIGVVGLPILWKRPRAFLSAILVSAALLAPLALWRAPGDPASGAGAFATRWRGNESLFAAVAWMAEHLVDPSLGWLVARAAVVLVVALLCVLVVRRGLPGLQALRALVWTVLLLSPQVHPWYLGWLLPLEVAAGGTAGLVWSGAALLAYAPLDRWVSEGIWEMPLWLQWIEYAAVAVALVLDPRRPSFQTRPASENMR